MEPRRSLTKTANEKRAATPISDSYIMSAQSLSGRSCDSKKVCVLLSGCGVFDGAEIHESVATLLALSKSGAEVVFAAPNRDQHHVLNHLDGTEMTEKRNIRVEAARIARGNVLDVTEVNVNDIDALFIPGGFGAAKKTAHSPSKEQMQVFKRISKASFKPYIRANKPIGAVCIAPAVLALSLGKEPSPLVRMQERLRHLKALAPHTKSVLSRRWSSILRTNWSLHQHIWKMLPFTKLLKALKRQSKMVLELC